MDMDTFYTCIEFARILKIHPRTVHKLIHRGIIRAVNVGSKKKSSWRIYDGELARLMAEMYQEIEEKKPSE